MGKSKSEPSRLFRRFICVSQAAIIAVEANPLEDIGTLENVHFVMKAEKIYKQESSISSRACGIG